MKHEVRFSVSEEAEQALQQVMAKLNVSRNQAAHFCMSVGAAAINAVIPDVSYEKLFEQIAIKVAEKVAPGVEQSARWAIDKLMREENLQQLIQLEKGNSEEASRGGGRFLNGVR